MMLDGEEGPTVRANCTMTVMLGLRLPDVIFSCELELLRLRYEGRRYFGLQFGRQWRSA